MTPERTKRLVANICMQMVRKYYHDLAEYFAGDEGRFTRMVVDGGKQLATASPQGWANHISNLAIECIPYHTEELRPIIAQIKVWGLKIDDSILSDEAVKNEAA